MSKRNKIIIASTISATIFFLFIYTAPLSSKPISQFSQLGQYGKASLEVSGEKYQSEIKSETTVYDFMQKLKAEGKINFKDKTYLGLGKFITEINGVQGNGEKYWIYYVNGKKAQVGVSNYKISPVDVVSWKYEKDY